jgi:serine/threonine protein kinase
MALIAQGTLEALHYLHKDLNIIHRDIKAANLLLTDEGKVKMSTTDFNYMNGEKKCLN